MLSTEGIELVPYTYVEKPESKVTRPRPYLIPETGIGTPRLVELLNWGNYVKFYNIYDYGIDPDLDIIENSSNQLEEVSNFQKQFDQLRNGLLPQTEIIDYASLWPTQAGFEQRTVDLSSDQVTEAITTFSHDLNNPYSSMSLARLYLQDGLELVRAFQKARKRYFDTFDGLYENFGVYVPVQVPVSDLLATIHQAVFHPYQQHDIEFSILYDPQLQDQSVEWDIPNALNTVANFATNTANAKEERIDLAQSGRLPEQKANNRTDVRITLQKSPNGFLLLNHDDWMLGFPMGVIQSGYTKPRQSFYGIRTKQKKITTKQNQGSGIGMWQRAKHLAAYRGTLTPQATPDGLKGARNHLEIPLAS